MRRCRALERAPALNKADLLAEEAVPPREPLHAPRAAAAPCTTASENARSQRAVITRSSSILPSNESFKIVRPVPQPVLVTFKVVDHEGHAKLHEHAGERGIALPHSHLMRQQLDLFRVDSVALQIQ
eukprot:CAMPEP_0179877114 /NCGR_PEP_ID=MMETSP0982-20121206/24626_1 /TAXON_ID=483367 /ORGANISM="non described non described, Strain CCMP 2436" /LENGTH=126 /DNA_ID=CAMNT_0021769709 /DNA_START=96 /DNA_END=477 /DNA_ORIENTATION=+